MGLPYTVVMEMSVIMYKKLGLSNSEIALYTSWLYLPWVIKPLWGPVVDLLGTKRGWIISLQLIIGAVFGGIALTIPSPAYLQLTLAAFWLLGFLAATQDIAIDGFYMLGLDERHEAAFIGVRGGFYRIATMMGQGALVVLAGCLERSLGPQVSWSAAFAVLGALALAGGLYHRTILPKPQADGPAPMQGSFWSGFFRTFILFFKRKDIWLILAFLLSYRLDKALMAKLMTPLLLDAHSHGGLGLSTSEVGFVWGIVGVITLTAGVLLGGYLISRKGLKSCLWVMVAAMHLPDAAYIFLAQTQTSRLVLVSASVALDQFGYGFGFAAYTMYMIMISEGRHKTSHYGICTGLMALGMMLPGMFSGTIQQLMGYKDFFLCSMLCAVPGIAIAAMIDIPPEFGIRSAKKPETIAKLQSEPAAG
jgi:PAT family beta-lactamase induction signal transducer AmpG